MQPKTVNARHSGSNGYAVTSNSHSDPIPFPRLSILQARIVLFVVSSLCFACSWDGEFVFDDSEAIVGNKDLDPSRPLSDILIHDFWGKRLTNTSHKSYRPLTTLTFRWNYWLSGGLHPVGFHIANFLLHGIVCVLFLDVFSLILYGPLGKWVSSRVIQNSARSSGRQTVGGSCDTLAFLCALMFAVHPIHTESVAGLVGRGDLLCALFFILSFLAYVRGSTQESTFRPHGFSIPWIAASAVLCGMATFSKEQGITVIGVCSAFDILSVCQIDLGELIGLKRSSSSSSPSLSSSSPTSASSSTSPASSLSPLSSPEPCKNGHSGSAKAKGSAKLPGWVSSLVQRHLFLAITAVVLLVTRWRIMGSSPPTFQVHDNPHSFVDGAMFRAVNYNYLYAINTWILLAPHWLCFDWAMGCVPTITSLTDPRILAIFPFWTAIGFLAWTCLKGSDRENARSLSLAVVLMVVPFLPATNIFFRVGFVVAERVLYLSSAGFCVMVCLGIRTLCRRRDVGKTVVACFLVVLCVFGVRSVQRSLEWRTEMILFKAGEKICPLNAKIHYNIAKLNGDLGNEDVAVERYRLAINLNPVYDQAMNNLANILKDQGHLVESEYLLDKAVDITPAFSSAWMNRGITKTALGKYREGEESYLKAISIRRNYPDCYYNLGNLYLEMKRHSEALSAFRNATNLKPTHWNSWNNAIILLDNLGHHDQAIQLGLAALRALPDHSNILYSLGNAYGKMDDFDNSEKMFLKAIRLDPHNSALYQNLGVVYHRWQKHSLALQNYEKAYQMDATNPTLVDNMNMLKRQMNTKK